MSVDLSQETVTFIIAFLLQASMILVFFLVLSKFLYRQKHVTKYNLLFFGLLLILICPLISSQINISFFNLKVKPKVFQETFSETKATPNSPVVAEKVNITKENSKTLSLPESVNPKPNIAPIPTEPIEQTHATEKSLMESYSLTSILFVIWLIGFVVFLVKTIFSFYRIKKLIYKGTPLLNREILKTVDEATKTLKLKVKPQVIISQEAISPFVFGVLNPKIIVPSMLIEKYEADSFKSILFHELAHIKRLDIAKGFLQIFLQNVLWFHPLIYIYNKEMNYSREEICDNYSLNYHQPVCYASILAELAESSLNQNQFLGVNSMISSKSELFNRVKNILDPNRTTSTKMKTFDLVTLSLILMLALISIGTFRLIEAEDNSKIKKSSAKTEIDLLDQKVTIDITKELTFNEVVNILSKSINQEFKIHESVKELAAIKLPFFIKAQNMTLNDLLYLLKEFTKIDYTIIGKQIIFASKEVKDLIDTNFIVQIFPVSQILHPEKADKKKDSKEVVGQLEASHIKELIIDKIARDSWDEAKGTSINVFDETLIIKHNKTVLRNIETFFSDIETTIKNTKVEIDKGNLYFGPEISDNLKNFKLELKKEVNFDWQKVSFEDLLSDIKKNHKILSFACIQKDSVGFEKLKNDKITLQIKSQSLESVLKKLLNKYSLKFELINGAICIGEPEIFNKILFLERYDITNLANKRANANDRGVFIDGDKVSYQQGNFTADYLSELIRNVLPREQWDADRGTSIVTNGNTLLITANIEMHSLIKEFLIALKNGKGKIVLPKSGM